MCGLIVGLPGEQKDDLVSTLKWVNENELNSIFFALGVTNNLLERPFLSEFERDAEKYDFKFDNEGKWYNDTWSRKSALEFANKLNNSRKVNTITSFNYSIMKSLGYRDEEITSKRLGDLVEKNTEFFQRKNKFIKAYKEKLLSL